MIRSVHDPAFEKLCHELSALNASVEAEAAWPDESLQRAAESGVFRIFLPASAGGWDWPEVEQLRAWGALAKASLAPTFILTQFTGAAKRIAATESTALRDAWLPDLAAGRRYATLGISHLTTSRRHLGQAAVQAKRTPGGFQLAGYSPWVTGGPFAQVVVTGAVCDDGNQLMAVVPTEAAGIEREAPLSLVALSNSATGLVRYHDVAIRDEDLLAAPSADVMASPLGGRTGGLQTSMCALGVAAAAIDLIQGEASRRSDLAEIARQFQEERDALEADVLEICQGREPCSAQTARARANSLALRSTQAALAAAKGTGFVAGHPAGRLCREALFFLVWSCPQPVVTANLCELAGIVE